MAVNTRALVILTIRQAGYLAKLLSDWINLW